MPHRAASPALSENDFDITRSLFQDDDAGADDDFRATNSKDLGSLDAGGILDLDSDGDGDEAFIKAQMAASNRKASNVKGKSVKKGGGFQAMGLNSHLLKAIGRKGFSVPTPIQRKTIPLVLDGQDVVGMARTGSGKTAAFVIPMIEKLKAHSVRVGARALILSPSRELALQTLKVVKEFSRGTDLKCVLLVGGDSLEEQFGFMAGNPDIVIATPGRFLHLKVEMSLDLSSVKYVVFDEADRLFEMGFAAQLTEILHALPVSRQTLLFSATLPKSLVEFARAGLQEPSLVRLDAESKISPDLQSAFFSVKGAEKEGALLHILNDLIKMPTGLPEGARPADDGNNKKRKRDGDRPRRNKPTEHSTIIFAATKHHVDYLASLLRLSGFAVSHAYGSLDQTARKIQVEDFRTGMTNILVVTDVAARGIDIPVLANVINYDFPPQPKVFVHRVGRTARAGQRGWSYSLVRDTDTPYLLDLQLFLGKRLILGRDAGDSPNYADDVIVGAMQRDKLEASSEWITKLLGDDDDLNALRGVSMKGEKLYIKTRNSASAESAKRAKEVVASQGWMQLHSLFKDETNDAEQARIDMLARISGFRPLETVFEIGTRGKAGHGEAAEMMRHRREKITPRRQKEEAEKAAAAAAEIAAADDSDDFDAMDDLQQADSDDDMEVTVSGGGDNMDEASEDELEVTFSKSAQKGKGRTLSWKDSENFMSYTPKSINAAEERGYGVHSGSYNTASQNSNFVEAARGVTMDLTNDDGAKSFAEPSKAKGMRWDKKNSKYVARANDEDGSKGKKMIRGESGQKIAASFQSGRFDRWRKAHKVERLPRTGEAEKEGTSTGLGRGSGTRYKHKQERAPKDADKYRDDFHVRKKRVDEAREKRVGRFRDGGGKGEIKSTEDIRKERKLAERKKAKNARPSKKGKGH
ncbi:ATP-dependent RNA helicase dbp10 [Coleophoma cylindrospora]|uniref:RNA helicase n=1 Tax=Coleophoma cylindrospora TaxID=1849047 RepID=A0A3D8R5P6_9HELO|nr:ATP-dependent RNA helicase dbp10 [Coleophoma cylindrospora]